MGTGSPAFRFVVQSSAPFSPWSLDKLIIPLAGSIITGKQGAVVKPMSSPEFRLARTFWSALGGDDAPLEALHFSGPAGGLPSRFHVSELASATIGVAALAAAELWAARREEPLRPVSADRRLAAAAFRCERLQQPVGWTLPAGWDPIAGDYETADGWIRLHTNYPYHRDAVT